MGVCSSPTSLPAFVAVRGGDAGAQKGVKPPAARRSPPAARETSGCGERTRHYSAQHWPGLGLPMHARMGAETSSHFLDVFASGVLKQP